MAPDLLYTHLNLINPNSTGSMISRHIFNKIKKEIKIVSNGNIGGHHLVYDLYLFDKNNICKKGKYIPGGDYDHLNSTITVDDFGVSLMNRKMFSGEYSSDPLILWHGDSSYQTIKYYKFESKEIYLIQGLNYFCNGVHCSSYEVLILQIDEDNTVSIRSVFYPGYLNLRFEDVFLFDKDNDGKPEILIPNDTTLEIKEL